MTDITTIIVVAVVVIVVAVLAVVAATMLRRRRSAELRDQFGPEYERTVRSADDPRDAEKELAQRRKRPQAPPALARSSKPTGTTDFRCARATD